METEDKQTVQPDVSEAVQTDAVADTVVAQKPYNGFAAKLDKFFGIRKNKSTFRAEIIGGLVTFMAMVYILFVNANMFARPGIDFTDQAKNVVAKWNVFGAHDPTAFSGISATGFGAIYIATAISAIIGTLLMAFLARMPLGQATGMGLNAFFVYTICLTLGLSYANALVLVLIDGIIFIILTVTGLRKLIFTAIPKVVRVAIPAGIGLFIAMIGLKNAGIIEAKESTMVTLAQFNLLGEKFKGTATYGSVMPMIATIIGVIAVAILSKKKVKGAMLYSILGVAALYWIFIAIGHSYGDAKCIAVVNNFTMSNPIQAFKDWGNESVGKVFTEGFDFSKYIKTNGAAALTLVVITSSLAFCMVDMFDTMGTLYGACARGNMLDKDGNIPNLNNSMLCDAIATTTGAVCGTSTVTTFVESSAGIAAGARTGFASLVTGACFIVAMFLSPIASMIPSEATSVALIYVGVLMMNCVREIEWTDAAEAVPAFLTIAMMPFTYNISYGIAFGIISWLAIHLILKLIAVCGKKQPVEGECKGEKINVVTIIIAVMFILMFFLTNH